MQHIFKSFYFLSLVAVLIACGGSGKEKGKLGDKKAELEKLKKEQKDVNDRITKLETELGGLDPASVRAKLVVVEPVGNGAFDHFIDLQGKIDANNTAYVAPRGMGGVVRALYVKKGDYVRKGQMVAKLDDAVARQQVVAASQQTGTIRAQLNLAKTTHDRVKNLWANNIGTEMQVIQAKAQVETLTSQLRAAEAQVGLAREQVSYSNVTASISGVVDQVNVRVGEQFVGATAAGPQITIVNTSVLKLLVQIPETYINRVKVGTPIVVTLPDANNRIINTSISVVSKLIDPTSRTFYAEANLPSDASIRANQIAKVQLKDYSRGDAITVPVNVLQTDQQGKFVLVAVNENKKMVARKKRVMVGELYEDRLEIRSGLNNGDQLITQGFENLYEGQVITTAAAK